MKKRDVTGKVEIISQIKINCIVLAVGAHQNVATQSAVTCFSPLVSTEWQLLCEHYVSTKNCLLRGLRVAYPSSPNSVQHLIKSFQCLDLHYCVCLDFSKILGRVTSDMRLSSLRKCNCPSLLLSVVLQFSACDCSKHGLPVSQARTPFFRPLAARSHNAAGFSEFACEAPSRLA
jgi:hypothetical protein